MWLSIDGVGEKPKGITHYSTVNYRTKARRLLWVSLCCCLVACTRQATISADFMPNARVAGGATNAGQPASATSFPAADETAAAAIRSLILAERQATIDGNLDDLTQLWIENGYVIDARGTATEADDYRWEGRAAILDRYLVAVLPHPPPPLPALQEDLQITVTDAEAVAEHGGDLWRFVRQDARWRIAALTYSRQLATQ
ncbi:MAG: hypothetical protein R3C14_13735 [Caldilineaceae bacterium]